jgi:NADH-quinone oxidoreductase subunit L
VFYAFHGKERFDAHIPGREEHHGHDDHHGDHHHAPHESPWVVTLPLVLLAIPSIFAGWFIGPILFGGYFDGAIFVSPDHPAMASMAREFHGPWGMMLHALGTAPFWLSVAGIVAAWYLYLVRPDLPGVIRARSGVLVRILEDKYGFDRLYDWLFARGAQRVGTGLWRYGDVTVIDGLMVNGSARVVGWVAGVVRWLQSGYIYHYAFGMIIGVFVILTLWLHRIFYPS